MCFFLLCIIHISFVCFINVVVVVAHILCSSMGEHVVIIMLRYESCAYI